MDQNENPNPDSSSEAPSNLEEQQSEANVSSSSDTNMSNEPQVVSPITSEPSQAEALSTSPSEQMTSVTAAPTTSPEAMVSNDPGKKSGGSRLWRKVAIICAVILVLAGGSAAAFYTVYLPSQPWYVLDTALKNTLAQNDLTANISANQASSGGLAFKVASVTAANLNNKQIDENLNVTVAGATIPVELRLVNSNLYFKFGDLSSVASLASLAGGSLNDPKLGAVVTPLLTSLSNQWVVIDSTLLEQNTTLKCLLNSNWTMSNSDSNYMVNTYLNQPFLSVKSTTSDTLNSVAEDKMSVSMNDNQAAKYFQELGNLSSFKSYAECTGAKASSSSSKSPSSLADGQTTPLTFWINKSTKRIDKIELVSTAADAKKGMTGSIDAGFNYGTVNVVAPTNAIPFAQLVSQLAQNLKGDPQLLNAVSPLLSKL